MAVTPDSTVLQEEIDENYEPSEGEIIEFASWLGMEFPQDKGLLWIAKEGLKAPLPAEWKPCRTEEDEIYYFNFDTGESSWDHPCDELYRNLYKEKAQEQQQQKGARKPCPPTVTVSSPKSSGTATPRTSPRMDRSLSDSGSRLAVSISSSQPDANRKLQLEPEQAKSPLVIKWKSAMVSADEQKFPESYDEQENWTRSDEEETWGVEKSMQAEILEKIKRELQEEEGTLVEQRRKEVIEEVERQIEIEKKRLWDNYEQKMQKDLEVEQEKLRQHEEERKARLKADEDEARRMEEELQARRKRREEDLAVNLQAEARLSEQRLEVFKKELEEEEAKVIEMERQRVLEEARHEAESRRAALVQEMKEDMMARMKQVVAALEKSMLEREMASARVDAEVARREALAKVEKEVEIEAAIFKEQLLKQRREQLMSGVHQQQQQHEESRGNYVELLLTLLARNMSDRSCSCKCEDKLIELRRSMCRLEEELRESVSKSAASSV